MKIFVFLVGLTLLMISPSMATELVYTPRNPSFGGPPLNGGFLLNKAEMQNKHKESITGYERDPLEDFKDLVTRRILSGMAGEILDSAFGNESDLGSGHYEFGDYAVDIVEMEGVDITITITDLLTGQTTTVSVPYIQ